MSTLKKKTELEIVVKTTKQGNAIEEVKKEIEKTKAAAAASPAAGDSPTATSKASTTAVQEHTEAVTELTAEQKKAQQEAKEAEKAALRASRVAKAQALWEARNEKQRAEGFTSTAARAKKAEQGMTLFGQAAELTQKGLGKIFLVMGLINQVIELVNKVWGDWLGANDREAEKVKNMQDLATAGQAYADAVAESAAGEAREASARELLALEQSISYQVQQQEKLAREKAALEQQALAIRAQMEGAQVEQAKSELAYKLLTKEITQEEYKIQSLAIVEGDAARQRQTEIDKKLVERERLTSSFATQQQRADRARGTLDAGSSITEEFATLDAFNRKLAERAALQEKVDAATADGERMFRDNAYVGTVQYDKDIKALYELDASLGVLEAGLKKSGQSWKSEAELVALATAFYDKQTAAEQQLAEVKSANASLADEWAKNELELVTLREKASRADAIAADRLSLLARELEYTNEQRAKENDEAQRKLEIESKLDYLEKERANITARGGDASGIETNIENIRESERQRDFASRSKAVAEESFLIAEGGEVVAAASAAAEAFKETSDAQVAEWDRLRSTSASAAMATTRAMSGLVNELQRQAAEQERIANQVKFRQ